MSMFSRNFFLILIFCHPAQAIVNKIYDPAACYFSSQVIDNCIYFLFLSRDTYLLPLTMLKLYLYYILPLLIAVFCQCASSLNNEQHTFSPIHPSTETVSTPEESNHYNDCTSNFATLERALFTTDNNRFRLISAFYPARETATLFLNVRYNFSIPENNQTELTVCHNWLWTTGTFYLIESPDVFLFTSLLFLHPENKIHTLNLTLPSECAGLAEKCAITPNEVTMLEILTRRVSEAPLL